MATNSYNVHVFPIVRVKIENIEAETPEKAIEIAEQAFQIRYDADHHSLRVVFDDPFDVTDFEDAEEISHYLVDPLIKADAPEGHPDREELVLVDYDNSRWYDANKKPTKWEKPKEYSLAEVRNGTGWPENARFVLIEECA